MQPTFALKVRTAHGLRGGGGGGGEVHRALFGVGDRKWGGGKGEGGPLF